MTKEQLVAAMKALNGCAPTETREKLKSLFWKVARNQKVIVDTKNDN